MTTAFSAPAGDTVLKPSLAILIVISAVNPVGLNIFMPSMPGMVEVFQTDYATVQLTLSLYLAAVALSMIFIGSLSDRYGRRPVVFWGMVIFTISSIVCALAPTIEVLIVGRFFQAIGGGTGIVLARAIVRDLHERDAAASMIGYVTMGMAIAPMITPAIGGVLDDLYGWRSSFYLLSVGGIIVVAAVYFTLHETNRNRGRATPLSQMFSEWWSLLTFREFWAYSGSSAFVSCLFFAFLGGAPLICTRYFGMTPTEYGFYFIMVAGGYAVGNFLSGRFASRVGVVRMVFIGCWVALLAVSATAAFFMLDIMHPLVLFLPMFFVGVGNGITLPSAIAGAVSVRPELAGSASGLSGTMQLGGGAIASAVTGALLESTSTPIIFSVIQIAAVLLGIAFALLLLGKRTPSTMA